jgi:hypothetical protein
MLLAMESTPYPLATTGWPWPSGFAVSLFPGFCPGRLLGVRAFIPGVVPPGVLPSTGKRLESLPGLPYNHIS